MKEIEFKYYADKILLRDFKSFCESKKPKNFINASGYDHFFKNEELPGTFYRHRVGSDMNQLTFKQKTSNDQNFIRIEHNLDLLQSVSEEYIDCYCHQFGYKYTSSIFKNSFVYQFDGHSLVYYICYNENLSEVGRYIEIEMSEEPGSNEKEAWAALNTIEKLYKPLGLTPSNRALRSLAEMYG